MAETILFDDGPSDQYEEHLSDDQMLEMLERAAKRKQETLALTAVRGAGDDDSAATKFNFPKLNTGEVARPYVSTDGKVAQMDAARLLQDKDRLLAKGFRKVEDPIVVKKQAAETKKATAGEQWYNLPRTDLTPELKRDLQLLKMRNVLDPHRHYKKDNGKLKAPEYSQVGTIVEGPTEYYSARLSNKERKRTFVEEVLASEKDTGRFKKKYGDVQVAKTSGKKAYYKALKTQRTSKR